MYKIVLLFCFLLFSNVSFSQNSCNNDTLKGFMYIDQYGSLLNIKDFTKINKAKLTTYHINNQHISFYNKPKYFQLYDILGNKLNFSIINNDILIKDYYNDLLILVVIFENEIKSYKIYK